MNYLADMISRIRVAIKKRASFVIIAYNKECALILNKMYIDGYITSVVPENDREIKIMFNLKYNMAAIRDIKMISTPGNKKYISAKELARHEIHIYEMYIMTNIGLLNRAEAISLNKGGIALMTIR